MQVCMMSMARMSVYLLNTQFIFNSIRTLFIWYISCHHRFYVRQGTNLSKGGMFSPRQNEDRANIFTSDPIVSSRADLFTSDHVPIFWLRYHLFSTSLVTVHIKKSPVGDFLYKNLPSELQGQNRSLSFSFAIEVTKIIEK